MAKEKQISVATPFQDMYWYTKAAEVSRAIRENFEDESSLVCTKDIIAGALSSAYADGFKASSLIMQLAPKTPESMSEHSTDQHEMVDEWKTRNGEVVRIKSATEGMLIGTVDRGRLATIWRLDGNHWNNPELDLVQRKRANERW